MQKLWKYLLVSPVVCASLIFAGDAFAQETPATSQTSQPLLIASPENNAENFHQNQVMAQITSVSQLSDVQPTDWAFVALQSLVERYGCIAGYPDNTYRG